MALLIHDPTQVERLSKRKPITESYWLRGCNDAKAGKPYSPPSKGGEHDRRNTGYANGYDFAQEKYIIKKPVDARVQRLIDACEGELDGLAVTPDKAARILAHVDGVKEVPDA